MYRQEMRTQFTVLCVLALCLSVYLVGCGSQKNVLANAPSAHPSVSVGILPVGVTVPQGGTQAFSATVTGSSNTAVTWSVAEGAAGGAITNSGSYTAPTTPGTYHVNATSQADKTVIATATVTVPAVSIALSPSASVVNPGHTRTFSADVEGTVNKGVVWALQEGSAAGIISDGIYTAPATLGTFHVIATSAADQSKSAMASVIVTTTAGSFGSTKSMIKVSGVHTATLLPSGQVLVAGGCIGYDFLEVGQLDAEIYDPVSGSFSTTGSMQAARCRHTATLLPSGKVLVIGGFEGEGEMAASALNTVELYDPATRTFSYAGSMLHDRAAHTSTLLANGKVLITGGATVGGWGFPAYGSATTTAEIYDPATNMFTATGSMATARFGHTATLLANGKVLVTGGFDMANVNQQASSLASAEIYDPLTGTFGVAGDMATARGGHTATLLQDGRVLVTGGFATVGPSTTVASSAELYDPSAGVFAPAGNMTAAREEHTATLLTNGQVLITGGAATSGASLAMAELYDPATAIFADVDSMASPRSGHSATLLQDGTVLISGGNQSNGSFVPVYLRSAEVFLPSR